MAVRAKCLSRDVPRATRNQMRVTEPDLVTRVAPCSREDGWASVAGASLRVGVEVVNAVEMSYIVQRKDRFYVVAYNGLDPLTGKERRRWHPVGHDRADAEQLCGAPGRWMFALFTYGFRVTVSPRGSPLFTAVLVHIWYMTARSRSSRRVVCAVQAAEGLSSACCATVTPRALAMSHSRARLVER